MDILSVVNFHIYSMWINESVKLKTTILQVHVHVFGNVIDLGW